MFQVARANWRHYSPPHSKVACPQATGKEGCCKIFSPSQVASSSSIFLHRIKYSLMTLFLNCLSLVSNIASGYKIKWSSSSIGGSSMLATTFLPMAFLRQDTWKILWILLPLGSSSSFATLPIHLFTLYSHRNVVWAFQLPLPWVWTVCKAEGVSRQDIPPQTISLSDHGLHISSVGFGQ